MRLNDTDRGRTRGGGKHESDRDGQDDALHRQPPERLLYTSLCTLYKARMPRTAVLLAVLLALVCARSTLQGQGSAAPATGPRGLDFQTYRTQVEPIFLKKRGDHARCYACHSQGTPLRLQEMSAGGSALTDEQSRANFAALTRVVVPGQPKLSRLLLMPLAHEAGGTEFHPGGKHFTTMDDPEIKTLVAWISDVKK